MIVINKKLLVPVVTLSMLSVTYSCSVDSNSKPKATQNAAKESEKSGQSLSQPSKEILALIESRKWDLAAREIYREALSVYPTSRDVSLNQAKSGFVDDAIASASKMRPDVESWVLFRIARDTQQLTDSKRFDLLDRAVNAVRGKAIAENLKSDALANAATLFIDLGANSQAEALMNEALSVAQQGASPEMRGASYRALADALERTPGTRIGHLISFAEIGAKRSDDSFHRAFSYAAIASIWHRLGNIERARHWASAGKEIAATISNTKQRALAENQFAMITMKMGDRSEAERQIAGRNGTFIDLLARDVVVDAAERGDYSQALLAVENIRGDCVSSPSRGQALKEVVRIQSQRQDLAAARKTLEKMARCPPRVISGAWLALAKAEHAAGQIEASQRSYSHALDGTGWKNGRPLDNVELQLLISIGDYMAQTGSLGTGNEILSAAIGEVLKMPAQLIEERTEGMARIAEAMARNNGGTLSSETAASSYRMAHETIRGMYPEVTRARALASVGLMLTEASRTKPAAQAKRQPSRSREDS